MDKLIFENDELDSDSSDEENMDSFSDDMSD